MMQIFWRDWRWICWLFWRNDCSGSGSGVMFGFGLCTDVASVESRMGAQVLVCEGEGRL